VVEQSGREVEWINRYLDQERVRGVADSTLRSYAHDLLHFLRWWAAAHKTSSITQQALTESTFLDYIRFPMPRVCLRPAFRTGTGGNPALAMDGHVRR
jgi:hypothetical protein